MARTTLTLDGLPDFAAWLQHLPQQLAADADPIVATAAQTTYSEAFSSYPVVTGGLREGLTIYHDSDGARASFNVVNHSDHALYFEYGTQIRRTALGYNRGAMPARPTLVRLAYREGQAMTERVAAHVRTLGFDVTGDR